MSESTPDPTNADEAVTKADVLGLFSVVEGPVLTPRDLQLLTGVTPDRADELLRQLVEEGEIRRRTSDETMLYWRCDSTPTAEPPAFLRDDYEA